MMLYVALLLTAPASSMPKPHCIKNTSEPVKISHVVSPATAASSRAASSATIAASRLLMFATINKPTCRPAATDLDKAPRWARVASLVAR